MKKNELRIIINNNGIMEIIKLSAGLELGV